MKKHKNLEQLLMIIKKFSEDPLSHSSLLDQYGAPFEVRAGAVWNEESGTIGGDLHTTKGPVSFTGGTPCGHSAEDVQSGSLTSNREIHLSRVNDAIREISERAEPHEAIRQLGTVLERLTQSIELAQARARLLFGKIDTPLLAELPNWLAEQLPALKESIEDAPAAHPLAVESMVLLVRACLNTPETVGSTAEIRKGPLGRVEVDWDVSPNRLQWLVEVNQIPWPGVKVYVLSRHGTGQNAQRETRILHNAFDVIEHFHKRVRP